MFKEMWMRDVDEDTLSVRQGWKGWGWTRNDVGNNIAVYCTSWRIEEDVSPINNSSEIHGDDVFIPDSREQNITTQTITSQWMLILYPFRTQKRIEIYQGNPVNIVTLVFDDSLVENETKSDENPIIFFANAGEIPRLDLTLCKIHTMIYINDMA